MKKRCFTRYDAHIDARYCSEDGNREWKSCLITKISRKGIGVVFPAHGLPLPGSLLTFTLPTAQDYEALRLQGVVKWIKCIDGSHAGGIELNAIVGEAQWLQMIYFIREPSAEKQFINLKTMPEHRALKKSVHPAPAKVVVPTAMDHIKTILNYKIL